MCLIDAAFFLSSFILNDIGVNYIFSDHDNLKLGVYKKVLPLASACNNSESFLATLWGLFLGKLDEIASPHFSNV